MAHPAAVAVGATAPVMPIVRGCRNRRCPDYAGPDGWCDAHRRPPFYGQPPMPPGWSSIRAAQLAAHPWCQDCGQVPASEVHHVRSRLDGGTDDPSNLRSLCWGCHRRITSRAGGLA